MCLESGSREVVSGLVFWSIGSVDSWFFLSSQITWEYWGTIVFYGSWITCVGLIIYVGCSFSKSIIFLVTLLGDWLVELPSPSILKKCLVRP